MKPADVTQVIIKSIEEAQEEHGLIPDPVLKNLARAFEALIEVALNDERKEERDRIADRLTVLGEGRLDYVFKSHRDPQTSNDIEAMGGTQGMIYGEATGARWLARIVRGDSDKGWLPSWRW